MPPASFFRFAGLGLLLAVPSLGQPAASAPAVLAPTVGSLGVPGAFEFDGNASFPASELRNGLAGVPEFLLTGHPSAPFDPFLTTVTHALRRGYLRSGFPDVAVSAAPDAARKRILVKITEGPRFRKGEVRVTGSQEVPAAELVRALTEASPNSGDLVAAAMETVLAQWRAPKLRQQTEEKVRQLVPNLPSAQVGTLTDPANSGLGDFMAQLNTATDAAPPTAFWERGKPAAFDAGFLRDAEEKARAVLAERGHPLATVQAALERDHAADVAHLVLQVREGPSAVIGEIRVSGNRRNTREDILVATGLAPGQPLTPAALTRAKFVLWNSARFYSFDATATPRMPPGREVDVAIEVLENETMPPLREPLSRLQTALVKFANWMTTQAGQLEMAISIRNDPESGWGIALSPGKGVLLDAVAKDGARLAMATGPAGSRAYIAGGGRSAGREFGRMALNPTVRVQLITITDMTGTGDHGWVSFGIVASRQSNHGVPVKVELIVSPSLAVTKFGGMSPVFEGAEVVLRPADSAGRIRFHEATGELAELDLTIRNKEDRSDINLRIGGSDFARLNNSFDAAWAALPPGARRESFAGVLLAQPPVQKLLSGFSVSATPGRLAVAAQLAERLIESPKFAAWWAGNATPDDIFTIPADLDVTSQPNAMASLFGAYYYQLATLLGAADAWPGKLGREIFYLLVGETRHTAAVLDELHADPQMGPLGSYVAAQLLTKLAPPAAARFFQRVSTRSTAADFRLDWQLLLDDRTELGRIAQDWLRALGNLGEAEVNALAGSLTDDEASRLRRMLTALREQKERPIAQVLQPFLDEWWEQQLRPEVERMRIAALSIDTPAQATDTAADCTRVIEDAGSSAPTRAVALVKRARARWVITGRPDSALADLNQAVATFGILPETLAGALMVRAGVSAETGRFDETIADATRALAMPESRGNIIAATLMARSVAYRQTKRPEEALADLNRLLDLPTVNPEILVNALMVRGGLHEEQGRKAEAAADYNRLLQLPSLPGELIGRIRAKLLFLR